ncbi:unnamed protein product [Blepharisma stoltei]|uniref:Ankyrin repeat protein n=1 Tax=Blepharisma stoltei TaxID=1481888 RepID=A0AAU9K907_9CILI|nr:unnamed protein product [Blepharisma stoltei]
MISYPRTSENPQLEDSAFHRAAKSGNSRLIECFIKAGANVNLQTKRSDAPLYLAAQSNHLDSISLLLQNGADPNMKNSGGNTALHVASLNGNYDLAKLLISHNASLRIKNERWQYPFHIAVKGNHANLIESFLNTDVEAALLKDLNGKITIDYCKQPESKAVFTRFILWRERKGILFVNKFSNSFGRISNGAFREIVEYI